MLYNRYQMVINVRFFLTFDTEDFINDNSIQSINMILKSLKKYDLKGLFFITGHMAERLSKYPDTVNMLKNHQIGYHTSSHSVHPTLFEFTDTEKYATAYEQSLLRETSHINPVDGKVEGRGGIETLRDVFPNNEIVSFRAPGHCWSPPHLEALTSLGIKFDFSANLSKEPVIFKEITFYPYPIISLWTGSISEYIILLNSFRNNTIVFTVHPSLMVNKNEWDSIYYGKNPEKISKSSDILSEQEISSFFQKFDTLLKQLSELEKLKIIDVTPLPKKRGSIFSPTRMKAEDSYNQSARWALKMHNYLPMYVKDHFLNFFQ